jgi:hypothetical protein
VSAPNRTRPANRNAPAAQGQRRSSARQHARDVQRQRALREKNTRRAIYIGIGVLILGALIAFLVLQTSSQPGKAVAEMANARGHINKGDSHPAYSSKPPTSGPHWNIGGEAPVNWGISKEQIPDEAQIHNLEHGGIMIQYNCRDCPELVQQMEDFYARWWPEHKLTLYPSSSKLVVAPYYDMPSRVTLTAWNRILTLDNWDEEKAVAFIQAWRDKGPEQAP